MKFLPIIILLFTSSYTWSQVDNNKYLKQIGRIDSLIQLKLNSGQDMLTSQKEHYLKLDSLRTVIFEEVQLKGKASGKCLNQVEWLMARTKLSDSVNKNSDTSRDSLMFLYSELTAFTKSRIVCLLQ